MANSEKQQERCQVEWGVNLFRIFLSIAAKRGVFQLSPEFEQGLAALMEEAKNEDARERVAENLNKAIALANQTLKSEIDPLLYAPFPPFSFVKNDNPRSGVLDQLDMVERTLTEAAHAELLKWEEEGNCFVEIIKTFTAVEQGKMAPPDAMATVTKVIEKINSSLPDEFCLPTVDLTAYEMSS